MSSYVSVELLFEIIPKTSILPEGFDAIDRLVISNMPQTTLLRGSCPITTCGKIPMDNTIAPEKIAIFRLYNSNSQKEWEDKTFTMQSLWHCPQRPTIL